MAVKGAREGGTGSKHAALHTTGLHMWPRGRDYEEQMRSGSRATTSQTRARLPSTSLPSVNDAATPFAVNAYVLDAMHRYRNRTTAHSEKERGGGWQPQPTEGRQPALPVAIVVAVVKGRAQAVESKQTIRMQAAVTDASGKLPPRTGQGQQSTVSRIWRALLDVAC